MTGTIDLGGGAPAGGAGEAAKETTTAGFKADVLDESRRRTVLVDFWAPWCGPCKQLAPALEKAVREAGGKVALVKMNIDQHPSIAGQLGIQSIPAVIAFRDGQPVDGFMGAIPESQIKQFIDKVAGEAGGEGGDQLAEALAAAGQAREAGDAQAAAQLYSAVLQQAPENAEALAGLAELYLDAGQTDEAKDLLAQVPEAERGAPAVGRVQARIDLAEETAALGDPADLERRIAENPRDHQARYDLAMIHNARGDREAAAAELLAIIRAERSWNDEAARTKLLQLFEAWGLDDPATLSARRQLSSLLFS
ncbi:thioredoxin [Aquibium sp. A9E412]|uniref:thioredoxin n=1 Tax=Aquibium sp. A9E412 TaxID=2976767 RepID=UPI0025AF16B7|nr:thioredoxin [Aquibium sp. A9E412]MDN2567401.1 thioredoxin [Aquibium sp. A9E412]